MAAGDGGSKVGQASGDNRSQVARSINPNLHKFSLVRIAGRLRRERLLPNAAAIQTLVYARPKNLATHWDTCTSVDRRGQLKIQSGTVPKGKKRVKTVSSADGWRN